MEHDGTSIARDDCLNIEEATALANAYFNTEDLRVVDFRVEAFAKEKLGYLAEHKLLSVKVQSRPADGGHRSREEHCTFFVKALAPNRGDLESLAFQQEKRFFGDALPRLLADFRGEPWAPRCHLVKDQLLVLEDLRAQGFGHAAGRDFTAGQLRTALASVARFHACSMMLRAKLGPDALAGLSFGEKTFVDERGGPRCASEWLDSGVEVAEGVARDLGLEPGQLAAAYGIVLREVQPVDASPHNVLAHEDLWSNNILFSADGQSCRLLDFQTLAYTSLAIDVLQLLYLNADKAARQASESQLVRLYQSTLEKTLLDHGVAADKVLSLEQVSRAIEEKRICGLVMAVQYGPISLLDKQLAKEYSEQFQRYAYASRTDLVKRAMQGDQHYRRRVEESVRELVDYMEHLQNT